MSPSTATQMMKHILTSAETLTPRDLYALAAVVAVGNRVHVTPERIAREAYAIADACLQERAK
jgi:predicted transcriptional regulator